MCWLDSRDNPVFIYMKLIDTLNDILVESYKLTFNDKQEIDKILRSDYEGYLRGYKEAEKNFKVYKHYSDEFIKQAKENGSIKTQEDL